MRPRHLVLGPRLAVGCQHHDSATLFRSQWVGTNQAALPVGLGPASAPVGQWEHTTFPAAGIGETP